MKGRWREGSGEGQGGERAGGGGGGGEIIHLGSERED